MNWLRWFVLFTFLPLVLSVLTGAISISYLALLPASVLAFSLLFETPSGFSVERTVEKTGLKIGEETEVKVKLNVERGTGIVLVGDVVSPALEIVDGTNRHVFFKLPEKKLDVEYSYRVRAIKRGSHTISPVEVEGRHFFELEEPGYALFSEEVRITASSKIMNIKRSTPRRLGRQGFPQVTRARMGVSSTDFREIREYRPGDPMRTINWKATARLGVPLVNEYEREGSLIFIFYVDASDSMAVGGFKESALEVAVSFMLPLVSYLLNRGYRVGLYALGHGTLISPVSGSDSLSTFTRFLLSLGMTSTEESLSLAVERTKRLLKGQVVPVVVTNLTDSNLTSIKEGLKKLLTKTGNAPVLVDVDVYEDLSAGKLVSLRKKSLREELAFPSVTVTKDVRKGVLKLLEVIL
ncbi:DUF58 domain-containing protein [Thermococcus sp.]|uniref:DUF58 domain-containing protein n=1 Tax=Thermococcus sp. TaxID=35749 RepID=UPI00260F0D7E|nr:DUF58 domain-containing protein [Thermococcus sp.]